MSPFVLMYFSRLSEHAGFDEHFRPPTLPTDYATVKVTRYTLAYGKSAAFLSRGMSLQEFHPLPEKGFAVGLLPPTTPTPRKGSDGITQCEHGKAPTRQFHSNTHGCL